MKAIEQYFPVVHLVFDRIQNVIYEFMKFYVYLPLAVKVLI